jgi:hypothetical protein
MFDHSRFVRLITVALASCAVTWALAVAAPAMPAGDTAVAAAAPAFQDVPGDTDKAPTTQPAAPAAGDVNKVPDPAQVQRVLNGIDTKTTQPVVDTTDDTGTVALALAIAALFIACGAVTLTLTRPRHPVVGA